MHLINFNNGPLSFEFCGIQFYIMMWNSPQIVKDFWYCDVFFLSLFKSLLTYDHEKCMLTAYIKAIYDVNFPL